MWRVRVFVSVWIVGHITTWDATARIRGRVPGTLQTRVVIAIKSDVAEITGIGVCT